MKTITIGKFSFTKQVKMKYHLLHLFIFFLFFITTLNHSFANCSNYTSNLCNELNLINESISSLNPDILYIENERNSSNPFTFNFPFKKELTINDYLYVQSCLKSINIESVLKEMYFDCPYEKASFGHFLYRCTIGLRLNLVDPNNQQFPRRELIKIGNGGENCIVCYVSFNANYPACLETIPTALERLGFNGYYLYQLGGFPNPTGIEIQYAGVPYSFKIPMMLEAKKLGFEKVLWIDSALLPIKDPTPFFDWIDKFGSCFTIVKNHPEGRKYVLKSTEKVMESLTGTDIVNRAENYFTWGPLLGLNLSTEQTAKFIEIFYECLNLGTPFLNGSPDEIVFTSILGMDDFCDWVGHKFPMFINYELKTLKEKITKSKSAGVFFYYRRHNEIINKKEYEDVFNELYP